MIYFIFFCSLSVHLTVNELMKSSIFVKISLKKIKVPPFIWDKV